MIISSFFLLLVTHVVGVQKFYTQSTANTFGDFSLGAGYDISRYEPKATHLFKEGAKDLLYDIMPITSTKTRCELITKQQDLSDKLYVKGALSITYNMITGSGEIVYDQKKETMSKVAYYTCTIDRTLYTISVNAPEAKENMEDLADFIPENIRNLQTKDKIKQVVGDYHIRSITYGRRYNTEIRLEYTSEDAFELISGKLKAEIGVGALSVSAEVAVEKDWTSYEQDLKMTVGSEALGFVEKAPLFLPSKYAPQLDAEGNKMVDENGTVIMQSPEEQIDAMIKKNLDAFNAIDADGTLKPQTGLDKKTLFSMMDDAYPLWYTVEKNQPYFGDKLAVLSAFQEAQMLLNLDQAYDILRELQDMTDNIQRRAQLLFDSYHLLSGATELSIEFLEYRQSLMDKIVNYRVEVLDYIKQTPMRLSEIDIYLWAAQSRKDDSVESRDLEYVSLDILHTQVWDLLGMEDVPMDHKSDIGATCLFNGIQATIDNTTDRRKFAGRVVFGDLTVRHVLFDIEGKVVSLGFIDHEHANRDNETWRESGEIAHELVFVREDCTLLRKGSDVWYHDSRYTISSIGSDEHLTPRGYVNKDKLTNIRLHLQPKDTTREIQVVITGEEVKDVDLRGHETSYGFTIDDQNRLMYKNGYVCDHLFKKTEANMICTTLGYDDVLYSKTGYEIPAANAWGRPHITMTDLKCKEMARGLDNDQCSWLSGKEMDELEAPWKFCGTNNGVQLKCVNGWVPNQNTARIEIESENVSCSRNEDSMDTRIDTAHSCAGGEGDNAKNFGHVKQVTVKGSVCVKLFSEDNRLDCVVPEQARAEWDFTNRQNLERFCHSDSLSDDLLPFPEKFEMMSHERPEPCKDDESTLERAQLKVIVEKGTKNETSVKLVKCEDGRELGLCYSAGDLPETTEIDDVSRKEFNDMCTKDCGECQVSSRKYYEIKVVPGADSFAYDVSGDIIPVEVTVLSAQYSSATDKEVTQQFSSVPKEEKDVIAFSNDYHCGEKIQFKVSPVHAGYNHGDVDDFGGVELSMVECRMSMSPGETGRLDDDDIVVIGGDIQVTFHCQNPPTSAPSFSLPTVSPSQNPTSSPKPTITPPTVSPTIFISPSQQPTASCKDFEGIFFKLKYNEVFFNYTCSLIRDTTEGGCNGNLGEVMKQYPGSYIPDERISEDMSVSDICPYIYKDICETCATAACSMRTQLANTFVATGCPNGDIGLLGTQLDYWENQDSPFQDMYAYCSKVAQGTANEHHMNKCCGPNVDCQDDVTSCVLQTSLVESAECKLFVSEWHAFPGVYCADGFISKSESNTHEECEQQCIAEASCESYLWRSSGTCHLRTLTSSDDCAASTAGYTMYIDVPEYTLLIRQTMTSGVWTRDALEVNSEDPDNDNYAILNQLEQFRSNDGKFYFKLTWPNSNENVTMEWSQTSNPLVEDVMGYEPINVPYTGRGWGGLEPSSSALMDGSVLANFKESWFWAVGAYSTWGGGNTMPAYAKSDDDWNHPQTQVELYVQKK